MKRCPRCGGTRFYTDATVRQEWIVDEEGYFVECTEDCLYVMSNPDDGDLWTCKECEYSDTGALFNVKEN